MLNILIGAISGVISGMGMGGGTILILFLSVFLGREQHTAQGANLIFFIPTAITSIITNIKQKLINWKIGITIAIFGTISAMLGATISTRLNTNDLKTYFGIFLLIIAAIEIFSFFKKQRLN